MANWIKSSELIKTLGYSKPVPGKMFTKNPNIGWIRKSQKGRGYEIDISSPMYQKWAEGFRSKKQSSKKKALVPVESPKTVEVKEEELFLSPEDFSHHQKMSKLKKDSDEAILLLAVKDLEKKKLDIEFKKIDYLKKAGKTMDSEFVQFYYNGYLDKCNMMLINSPKKISPDIEIEIYREMVRSVELEKIENEDVREEVKRLFSLIPVGKISLNIVNSLVRKQESIIIDIKNQQKKDLLSLQEA